MAVRELGPERVIYGSDAGGRSFASQLAEVPAERILLGSHAPLYYFEAAELKLRESPLAPEQHRLIAHGNAEALLP
jgi:predicted TIM-barrel fold metal-dependent hydrolase